MPFFTLQTLNTWGQFIKYMTYYITVGIYHISILNWFCQLSQKVSKWQRHYFDLSNKRFSTWRSHQPTFDPVMASTYLCVGLSFHAKPELSQSDWRDTADLLPCEFVSRSTEAQEIDWNTSWWEMTLTWMEVWRLRSPVRTTKKKCVANVQILVLPKLACENVHSSIHFS